MPPIQNRPSDLFPRGAPPWLRSGLYVLLSLICLVADQHSHRLDAVRQTLYVWTLPLREVASLPFGTEHALQRYFSTQEQQQAQIEALQRKLLRQGTENRQLTLLTRELAQLRALDGLRSSPLFPSRISRILALSSNPYIQKLVIEGGKNQGVTLGSPVFTDQGLVGQVTEVYPERSEVTLISNRDLTVPVEIERTGLHTLALGTGHQGEMTLPYVPSGTDVRPGDVLMTSGIDGLYPRGITVATVSTVTRHSSTAFAEITCRSNPGGDTYTLVLVGLPAPADHGH